MFALRRDTIRQALGKMISPDDYIEQRLSDQIGWYDRKR
jgi:hypothetical protein